MDAFQQFCFQGSTLTAKQIGRRPLTDQQKKVFNLARVGWQPMQIANRTGLPVASVYDALHKIRHNGWEIDHE